MKSFNKVFKEYKSKLYHCLRSINAKELKNASEIIWKAYREDRQVFICGNGGSAATSSHLVCDLGKGTAAQGKRRLRIIGLSDNVSLISAWSNDTCYENCFKEQLVNLLRKGDVLIGISASGNSENVLEAVRYAKSRGAVTIGLVGFGGGKLRKIADVSVLIDSDEYEVVEDIQLCLGHILKKVLQELLMRRP